MLPKIISERIEQLLTGLLGRPTKILSFSFIGGGCINESGKLFTDQGVYFTKWNDALKYPKMFEKEQQGLELLQKAGAITVPEVILQDEAEKLSFIAMEYIEPGSTTISLWEKFGQQLAHLHMHTNDKYGLDHDNYIGYLPQVNDRDENWITFFIKHRLYVQGQMATENGLLSPRDMEQLEQVCLNLPGLIPEENPALLHGDLWSGNYMVSQSGEPVLIDPAVYYGHREVDLSMMKLFGGFDHRLFEAYHEAFPLQPGFEMRVDLFNLYPLLVHVNLFGASYVSSVRGILKKYS